MVIAPIPPEVLTAKAVGSNEEDLISLTNAVVILPQLVYT
jgi:hypothetical protein